MATMVKEKRREKKKSKEKSEGRTSKTDVNSAVNEQTCDEVLPITEERDFTQTSNEFCDSMTEAALENIVENLLAEPDEVTQPMPELQTNLPEDTFSETRVISSNPNLIMNCDDLSTYFQCNLDLNQLLISESLSLQTDTNESNISSILHEHTSVENVVPSAPVLEEEPPQGVYQNPEPVEKEVVKLKSMPLEEAVRLFEGTEMAVVLAMSEREEAIVNMGPLSGPEHPLVDLLSTFRRSLIEVENGRAQITIGFAEEEKFRSTLWKVEKKVISEIQKCKCGLDVPFMAKYDHAELQRDRLPVARMKLEVLLREVQESYCHHQHAALLAHYQIEEYVSGVVEGSKGEIREALSLVLQALRLSDGAPPALAAALQRWVTALAHALVDQRDLRQLLFLIHHLFRQTRSVRWAARVLDVSVPDSVGAARLLALMEVLFARTALDAGVDCLEFNKNDVWEELDKDGSGGAVSEGALRERDLLALLHALPLRDLVARIVLLTQSDIREAREYSWEAALHGRGVVRASSGVRALLGVLGRAVRARAAYTRLRARLRALALHAMRALAALHRYAKSSYVEELEYKVLGELQAVFVEGLAVVDSGDAHEVPASLLADHAAKDYCETIIESVLNHGEVFPRRRVESLSLELPQWACQVRVRVVAAAAAHRRDDAELAGIVLNFLFQVGVRSSHSNSLCKGGCRHAARECMPKLLDAHPFLFPVVLKLVADTNIVERVEQQWIECLNVSAWRPTSTEVVAVLEDWSRRCPHLLPALLLNVRYTANAGISLDSQLAIGWWLSSRVEAQPTVEAPEWAWAVLRRLRTHRVCWAMPLEAPPPPQPPQHLLGKALALLASSWGHCIPVICSEGVEALYALATTRAADALHCMAPIMQVLAASPESVAATPRFGDVLEAIVSTGPGVVQRAFGRGMPDGATMLLRLLRAQLRTDRSGDWPAPALARAWVCAAWRRSEACAAPLDAALCSRAGTAALHMHAEHLALAQDEQSQQQIVQAMRWYTQAPLLAESAMRAWHAEREHRTQLYARLLDALHAQRRNNQRIHVDNALKSLGACVSSEALVVYRVAEALRAAPAQHPAALLLWRLLLHLYLQRPPCDPRETTPPAGPLFFSGIIKSRTLAHLKRRIQDHIKYHATRASQLQAKPTIVEKPSTSRSKSKSVTVDENLTLPLTIKDLTGESSDSDDDLEGNEEDFEDVSEQDTESDSLDDVQTLLTYHIGAERMLSEYARWLDEPNEHGPHHADLARYIPEHALEAAFRFEADRRKPSVSPDMEHLPLPPRYPSQPPPPPQSPFQDAKDALLQIRDSSGKRSRRRTISSPMEKVDFRDIRKVLSVVDKHMKDIEKLSQEWKKEAEVVESIDRALWPLVTGLRVPRALPTMRSLCPNKCEPVHYTPPSQEWCISIGAEQGIRDNRLSARAGIRKLSRPRVSAARCAAAMLAIARGVVGGAAAGRVAERVWRSAGAAHCCPPACALLDDTFSLLAERWLVSDGELCSQLLSWAAAGSSALQQRLLGAALAPQRAPPAALPALHAALLRAPLPPHALFSYLSKFDLNSWSQSVDSVARCAMLESLMAAAQRWGPAPDDEYQPVIELLGVQTYWCVGAGSPAELCGLLRAASAACTRATLPTTQLRHVLRAAERGPRPHYAQLGQLLRDLGTMWWEVRGRSDPAACDMYGAYAALVAQLLRLTHTYFVAAAQELSYLPVKVAAVSWASLQEAWSPWLQPHASPPLLSAVLDDSYSDMLSQFIASVHQIMEDCPGTEPPLLNSAFEWAVHCYMTVSTSSAVGVASTTAVANTKGAGAVGGALQEARVQASALLAALATLPWDRHQWLTSSAIQAIMQISQCNDREILSWSASCLKFQDAMSWMSGAPDPPAGHLAALLYLFTASYLTPHQQTLDTACQLPWSRLPEAALEEALERFFAHHHGVGTPYHELPQFGVIVAASEMQSPSGAVSSSSSSRQKRARLVSLWVRAGAAPSLRAHAAGHCASLLQLLRAAASLVEPSELNELFERALVIMCIEPAACAAAPVWEQFILNAEPRVVRACLHATVGLTVFEYFALLADAALRTYLAQERGQWSYPLQLWSRSVWPDAAALGARGRLAAAYCAALAAAADYRALRAALLAVLAADFNFIENELIVSAWICLSCRVALECERPRPAEEDRGRGRPAEEDCAAAAKSLLARWGARRPLLSLRADHSRPTHSHRLLCLLALCVLSPGDESLARTYESFCVSLMSSSPDLAEWGRTPHPKRLPRLATRLYPKAYDYFERELSLMPEEL